MIVLPWRLRLDRDRAIALALALGLVGLVLLSLTALALAVIAYPGEAGAGFLLWGNYVCDLLRASTRSGAPNPSGGLATAALLLFAAALVPFFLLLRRIVPEHGALVGRCGVASAAGWAAMALSPSDRLPFLHGLFVAAGILPGLVAGVLAVRGLAARRETLGLALLGGSALGCAGLDAALYFLLHATGAAWLEWLVPALQRPAGVLLVAWMLGVALRGSGARAGAPGGAAWTGRRA